MKRLWELYKKYNLGVGLVLTLIGLWLSFSPPDQNARLIFYWKSSDLIKVSESNENLKIYFRGQDIQEKKLSLNIFDVTLVNSGRGDVRVGDYDPLVPFALLVTNGFVTGFSITDASDKGLMTTIHTEGLGDSTHILLNKIIIKSKQWVKLKFVVLHKMNEEPKIACSGRIANATVQCEEGTSNDGVDWAGLFTGLAWIAIIFGGLYLGGYLIHMIFKISRRFVRKNAIHRIYRHVFDQGNVIHRLLVRIYCEVGSSQFKGIMELLSDQEKLNRNYNAEIANKLAVKRFFELKKAGLVANGSTVTEQEYTSSLLVVISTLVTANFIIEAEGQISIKPELLAEIRIIQQQMNEPH
jgi:hypothetical protein